MFISRPKKSEYSPYRSLDRTRKGDLESVGVVIAGCRCRTSGIVLGLVQGQVDSIDEVDQYHRDQ
jgi:hypothetical protein